MATAEIIAIGTELLLGMTQDTNTHYLANALRSMGVDLYRTTVIGDNEFRITELVKESLTRADIIITTGGLGPTVDDPTRAAIANTFGATLQFHPSLWDEICERFKHYGRIASENNKRQAYIPSNATVIKNDVGTAPAFYIFENNKLIVSLPGVPKEMEYLFTNHVKPLIAERFPEHAIIITKILHLIGIGESHVDQLIGDLETLSNPTVGLSAHAAQIDIRITAKSTTQEEALQNVEKIKSEILDSLAEYIYGEDEDTLDAVINKMLEEKQQALRIALHNHPSPVLAQLSGVTVINAEAFRNENEFVAAWQQNAAASTNDLAFAVFDKPDKMILLIGDKNAQQNPLMRTYLGPREDFPNWLTNNELGYLYTYLKAV